MNEAWQSWHSAAEKAAAPAEWEAKEAARKTMMEAQKAWEKAAENAEAMGAAQKAYLQARKAFEEARTEWGKKWEKAMEEAEDEALKAMAPAEWEAHEAAAKAEYKTRTEWGEKAMEKAVMETVTEELLTPVMAASKAHQEAMEKTGWSLEKWEKAVEKIFMAKLAYEAAQAALRKAAPEAWKAYEAAQARQN